MPGYSLSPYSNSGPRKRQAEGRGLPAPRFQTLLTRQADRGLLREVQRFGDLNINDDPFQAPGEREGPGVVVADGSAAVAAAAERLPDAEEDRDRNRELGLRHHATVDLKAADTAGPERLAGQSSRK